MPVTQDDVARMATLARLETDASTRELFSRQFAEIIAYMDILEQVDTQETAPLYTPAEHEETLREDAPLNRRRREEVLENAPEHDGRYFVVPRII